MRRLALVLILLSFTGCAGGWEERSALGSTSDGARYGSGWLFGGPHIYVYPSGTVHRRYEGGTREMRVGQKVTYIDKQLWVRLAKLVQEKGGNDTMDLTSGEESVCDGGYESLYIRIGDKSAYFIFDGMACEETIEKHDAAGREAVEIFRELAKTIEEKLD